MLVTTGQVLRLTVREAWPTPLLVVTFTTTEAEAVPPWVSVTAMVRV